MRSALVFVAASSLLRVCGHSPSQMGSAPTTAAVGTSANTGMIQEHGGAVAVSGGLTAEVAAQPDGRLIAYVRDPQQQPVQAASVTLSVRRPDGQVVAVPVAYDPSVQAYVGRPSGLVAGAYPVEVAVQPTPTAPAVELVTPPVTVVASPALPAPHYGGRVQLVGDHAVETVVAQNGDVAMFWMDLDGNPIPASQVQQPNVQLTLEGRPVMVPTRVVNGHFVAHFSAPVPAASVQVGVPTVAVGGVVYHSVVVPRPVVVAALPPVIVGPPVVAVGAPAVEVGVAAPAVVVAPPAVGVVVEAPPPPVFGVGVEVGGPVVVGGPGVVVGGPGRGHWDNGWHGGWHGGGRGEWHGGGGGWGGGGGGGWHGGGGGGWHGGGHGRR